MWDRALQHLPQSHVSGSARFIGCHPDQLDTCVCVCVLLTHRIKNGLNSKAFPVTVNLPHCSDEQKLFSFFEKEIKKCHLAFYALVCGFNS